MSRVTKHDWLDRYYPPLLIQQPRRKSYVKAKPSRRPKNTYFWKMGKANGHVEAYTRSEARSEIKKALGLKRKHRLPVGTKITLIG